MAARLLWLRIYAPSLARRKKKKRREKEGGGVGGSRTLARSPLYLDLDVIQFERGGRKGGKTPASTTVNSILSCERRGGGKREGGEKGKIQGGGAAIPFVWYVSSWSQGEKKKKKKEEEEGGREVDPVGGASA